MYAIRSYYELGQAALGEQVVADDALKVAQEQHELARVAVLEHLPLLFANLKRKKVRTGLTIGFV